MSDIKFQNAYSSPVRTSDISDFGPSLTSQEFKDEVDINVMLRKFNVTGQLPVNVVLPTYGDFTGLTDYRSAIEVIQAADAEFMKLPAEIRARFGHSPQAFLEFCSDARNKDELKRLGLLKEPDPVPEPMAVRLVEPKPSAAS